MLASNISHRLLNAVWFAITFISAACNADIAVGMSAPLNGPQKNLGIELYRGAELYFHQVNQRGGIQGTPIEFIAYDDGGDPIKAIKNTVALVEFNECSLLMNYTSSECVIHTLPLFRKYAQSLNRGLMLFGPFEGAQLSRHQPYQQWVSHTSPSYRQLAATGIALLLNAEFSTFNIVYENSADGRSMWDGCRRALEAHGTQLSNSTTISAQQAANAQSLKLAMEFGLESPHHITIVAADYPTVTQILIAGYQRQASVKYVYMGLVGRELIVKALLDAGIPPEWVTSSLLFIESFPQPQADFGQLEQEYVAAVNTIEIPFPNDADEPGDFGQVPTETGFRGYLAARQAVEMLQSPSSQKSRVNITLSRWAPKQFETLSTVAIDLQEQ